MGTNSVYDPTRHRPEIQLRLANAALLNAAIAYVASPNSRELFKQLQVEAAQVVDLRKTDPLLSGQLVLASPSKEPSA